MELRVWVDGTQRVVCGVKLTTTCQEIVFALAHATQQAGRFTMIERWRNNERLLSPNEQPLVTLQRWGERMNEVEFVLRRTSTEHPPQHSDRTNHLPSNPNQQIPQLTQVEPNVSSQHDELTRVSNDNEPVQQPTLTNGQRSSPSNMATTSKQLLLNNQQVPDSIFHQSRQYKPTRRPQTVLGPLTSSNSALNLGSTYMPNQINRFSNSFRPSLSASTLPNLTNNMNASPSNPVSILRPRYTEDGAIGARSPSALNDDLHNGYPMQSENQQFQIHSNQARVAQSKNFTHEDLYSTINKKRTNHMPPIVPAKPRLLPSMTNPAQPQQTLTSINNAQLNYYQPNQSPLTMHATNVRPRDPPGYLQYLEAMANRNSLPAGILPNSNYIHYNQFLQSNMLPRQIDQHQIYQQSGTSPASSLANNCYQTNGQTTRALNQSFDISTSGPTVQNVNSLNPKFVESTGVVINRGSAINVKLHSNSQPTSCLTSNITYENLNNSTQSNSSSVSQIGHDMLKVIEEQKRVLMNQKNELDRLDNDQEYLEAKQNSEQAELINRIENEIHQLEKLWGENQSQIKKLENQDFEKELDHLKSEQVRMEHELLNQKNKLSQLESDITECLTKIQQLETELNHFDLESDESIIESEGSNENIENSSNADLKSACQESNGLSDLASEPTSNNPDSVCSDDDDYEDDSGGDASDDLITHLPESKLRNAKEVPYVDKRGLISGIRSLKLDKSRSLNKSSESCNSNDMTPQKKNGSSSPKSKPASNMNNNLLESCCSDTNGHQLDEKTANSNKYEFLMTL